MNSTRQPLPSRAYVIAEAGVNHNGEEELALRLIGAAVHCGADAIKFQTFRADRLVHRSAPTAEYQQSNTGEDSQHAMLRRLELPGATLRALVARCREMRIEFLSTPFDPESADELIELGMRRIKIPSGELTNLLFLRHLARARLPLIVSTGMATLDEVTEAVGAIRDEWHRAGVPDTEQDLVLLHCTSNYPAQPDSVNLRAMHTLARRFGVPVGYSDHTEGLLATTAAVAMGATVVEKHFTLSRDLPGPDHRSSLEPEAFARLVREVRQVEQMLGNGEKVPAASELSVRDLVRRSIVSRLPIAAGAVVREEDLELLRPGTGIEPRHLWRLIGRRANHAIPQGEILRWDQFSE